MIHKLQALRVVIHGQTQRTVLHMVHVTSHLALPCRMTRAGESSRRSEADSEEAVQDVCALSQEGSLGSFSDSDRSFKLRMAAAAECDSAPFPSCRLPLAKLEWTVKTQLQHRQGCFWPLSGSPGMHSPVFYRHP